MQVDSSREILLETGKEWQTVRVGITGHQDLGTKSSVVWVSGALAHAVREYRVTRGFTSLAAGADQLFAEILHREGIPYVAVIPSHDYGNTFSDKSIHDNYSFLVAHAEEIVRLEYGRPEEAAFFAAGKRVVDLSQIIFAVWDGKRARGLGGTADIVRYAILNKKQVVHFNPVRRQTKTVT